MKILIILNRVNVSVIFILICYIFMHNNKYFYDNYKIANRRYFFVVILCDIQLDIYINAEIYID